VAEKEVRSCLALREVRRRNNYSMCQSVIGTLTHYLR
jgi:hypothetical protein